MAYQIAPFLVTLSDLQLQGHLPFSSLFKCIFVLLAAVEHCS